MNNPSLETPLRAESAGSDSPNDSLGTSCDNATADNSFFLPLPNYDQIKLATEDLYFDGKYFWHKHPTSRWENLPTDSATRLLRVECGLSAKRPENTVSEIDQALRFAEREHRVAAGAPFVHDKRDIIVYRGEKYLNTSTVRPIGPADSGDPKRFPWLDELLRKRWAAPQDEQRDFYLAWFQRLYSSALDGKLLPGQHVLDAGERGTGKTLISRKIVGAALGGTASAANFLKGKTSFNSECARYAIWTMDDEDGTFTWEQRMTFSNSLKSSAANQELHCEPKFYNSFTLPWFGRVYLTCNTDARSLNIVPDLSGGISDKLMLFRGGGWMPEFLEREANEKRIEDELPHFLRWLIEWKPPAYVLSEQTRYGVKSYHHPTLVKAAKSSSSETRLREILCEWRTAEPSEPTWYTASGLKRTLSTDLWTRDALKEFGRDRMREALEGIGPEFVLKTRSHGGNQEYLIDRRKLQSAATNEAP